jgi:hypothetical protein
LHVHPHASVHHLRDRSACALSRQHASMDGRTKQIVRVIVIIIGVLSLLGYLVNF